jgi:hypothetical protein
MEIIRNPQGTSVGITGVPAAFESTTSRIKIWSPSVKTGCYCVVDLRQKEDIYTFVFIVHVVLATVYDIIVTDIDKNILLLLSVS